MAFIAARAGDNLPALMAHVADAGHKKIFGPEVEAELRDLASNIDAFQVPGADAAADDDASGQTTADAGPGRSRAR